MLSFHECFLPTLDCHAHISPDVTDCQINMLGKTIVFSMTRSLAEASEVQNRSDLPVIWACGVHPSNRVALYNFNAKEMLKMMPNFMIIGEIGLDCRAADLNCQKQVFEEIISIVIKFPVICSIHSAGCTNITIDILLKYRPQGAILHWFTGSKTEIEIASSAGFMFSVNNAMTDEQILQIPHNRILLETDFPVRHNKTGIRPGDTILIEKRLGKLWGKTPEEVRIQCYRNLRDLAVQANVLERLPDMLADNLLAV